MLARFTPETIVTLLLNGAVGDVVLQLHGTLYDDALADARYLARQKREWENILRLCATMFCAFLIGFIFAKIVAPEIKLGIDYVYGVVVFVVMLVICACCTYVYSGIRMDYVAYAQTGFGGEYRAFIITLAMNEEWEWTAAKISQLSLEALRERVRYVLRSLGKQLDDSRRLLTASPENDFLIRSHESSMESMRSAYKRFKRFNKNSGLIDERVGWKEFMPDFVPEASQSAAPDPAAAETVAA